MNQNSASREDEAFRDAVEDCSLPVSRFNHRAHIRLAYVYLASKDTDAAHEQMRAALLRLLEHNGVDPQKYHETLTRAWILAVAHFMAESPSAESADEFIAANPQLLDKAIMGRHYSADLLATEEARLSFVEPDVTAIPSHGG